MRFRILHYHTLDSTNNLARAMAEEGASEGTVICAEYQTRGRGRFKRKWISGREENLLLTIVLRPQIKTSSAAMITHLAARAVQDLLKEKFHINAALKRPNDVLVDGKKIAGILTESSSSHDRIDYMIVGIGLNVNGKPKGLLKATSIRHEVSSEVDRQSVLDDLLAFFEKRYKMGFPVKSS